MPDIKSREATALIELVVTGMKQLRQMMRSVGGKLEWGDIAIMSAIVMETNSTAHSELASRLHISCDDAEDACISLGLEARQLAVELGKDYLLNAELSALRNEIVGGY
ncbi:MAG: hypothetical protein RLO50_20715 [Azospirillaceae bacterium]